MVAMTRSRNNLYLTYCGYAHSYLNAFKEDCHHIDIHDSLRGVSNPTATNKRNNSSETTNPFGI